MRVPWHDTGWTGTVCGDPVGNATCLLLENIGKHRRDDVERANAGREIADLPAKDAPPCVAERSTFMSSRPTPFEKEHPFADRGGPFAHYLPTPVPLPPYSGHAVPFRWMARKGKDDIARERRLNLRPELEDAVDAAIGWKANWVMHGENQRSLLDAFFATVRPDASLVFFYAKHSPLSEDPRRLLVGAAEVTGVTPGGTYRTDGAEEFPAELWETVIQHSLRPDRRRGFLMPYQELMAARDQRGVEIDDALAFAPEPGWTAFSYVTEHINHDLAIDALLTLASAGRAAERIVGTALPESGYHWIDAQLTRLWGLRGPYPGFGSAVAALGVPHGTTFAHALAAAAPGQDLWMAFDEAMDSPGRFGEALGELVPTSVRAKWRALTSQRRALLQLLSRFALTPDQATRYFVAEERVVGIRDEDLIADPYLLAYHDRTRLDPIAVTTVDRGCYPSADIAAAHPLPEPSRMSDHLDARRVRALLIDTLDGATSEGHTLLAQDEVVRRTRQRPLAVPCPIDADLLTAYGLTAAEVSEAGPLGAAALADGSPAYQLREYAESRELIRRTLEKRLAKPLPVEVPDFTSALEAELGDQDLQRAASREADELEQRARTEKVAALESLFASRFSVLVGSAGTGKTTLLKVLCDVPSVREGKVLLLAPTGKARVRLAEKVDSEGASAATIAQFLRPSGRYDTESGAYRPTNEVSTRIARFKTVIVDEASMLTEPQLAALLDALNGYHRLILVGDPCQLPPIGPGRPFVDIVARLRPADADSRWPRIGTGYGELTVTRRQIGADRDDLALASWFADGPLAPIADEVWGRLCRSESSGTLRAVKYDRGSLHSALLAVLKEELPGCADVSEEALPIAFAETYGGVASARGFTYFPPGDVKKVDEWQILSPVRGRAWGTTELNRMLKDTFRSKALEQSTGRRPYNAPSIGPERIVVGDKVINVRNHTFKEWRLYPKTGEPYVANGELGVVVGQTRSGQVTWRPNKTEVVFAGRDTKYHFDDWHENPQAPMLELAWAVTVHKAQGSEYGLTVVVVPAGGLLGRELIYTALTRQRERVILLHEEPLEELTKLWSADRSDTARRLTNLFRDPDPIAFGDVVLDRGLLHVTENGELVRTVDEVRIADILRRLGLTYTYRPGLDVKGVTLRPTFEIMTELGDTAYWEHLGDPNDPAQIAAWQRRLAWYAEASIVPFDPDTAPDGALVVTWSVPPSDPGRWEELARAAFDV